MIQTKPLTLGSLFDGSGGFPLGALALGIQPLWASEIEPFPVRVTTKRMPFMKHYGDVCLMRGDEVEPVDIISFGSPCQDLSIAGKQKGLVDGERSSLFFEAIRLIKEMREATNGRQPRFIVWENVPGAFSSNGGSDFKAVLESIIRIKEHQAPALPRPEKRWPRAGGIMGDGWSIAYRTLDAQYFGVAQRRRRIYLVADFDSQCASEVLFECQGMRRHFTPCFCSRKTTASGVMECPDAAGGITLNDQGGSRMDVTLEYVNTLRAQSRHPPCVMQSVGIENHPADSRMRISPDGKAQALTARMGTGGNNVPLTMKIRSGCEGGGKGSLIQENKSATLTANNEQSLFEPVAYGISAFESYAMLSDNPVSGIKRADVSRTLDVSCANPSCHQGGLAICVHSITSGSFMETYEDKASTLVARDHKDPQSVSDGYRVRRLLPVECARLQGFPDEWCDDLETAEPSEEELGFFASVFKEHARLMGKQKARSTNQVLRWLKNPYSDTAAYKLWGNGIALPCAIYIFQGIKDLINTTS